VLDVCVRVLPQAGSGAFSEVGATCAGREELVTRLRRSTYNSYSPTGGPGTPTIANPCSVFFLHESL
jgi:hypothetical protein